MQVYDLTEYKTLELHDYHLDDAERQSLYAMAGDSQKPRFYWRELRDGLQLSFTSWAGVIQLRDMVINIRPKFDRNFQGLLAMLTYAEGSDEFIRHEQNQYRTGRHLLEIIAILLCDRIDALLKVGLFKEYVLYEENLTVLRGRPDLQRQLLVNQLSPTKLACRFDELETNIPENQIILSALRVAGSFALTPKTAFRVRGHLNLFAEICEPFVGEIPADFAYNRLNEHYRGCHEFCRLVLKRQGADDIFTREEQGFFCLLIDMNLLFERFIARLIDKHLPAGWRLFAQKTDIKAILGEGGTWYRLIKPDLLIRDPQGRQIVMDTKYKLYGQKRVDNSDIYQLAFYAQAFETKQEDRYTACIIYPCDEERVKTEEQIRLNWNIPDYRGALRVLGVDLAELLADIRERRTAALEETVRKWVGV